MDQLADILDQEVADIKEKIVLQLDNATPHKGSKAMEQIRRR